MSKHIRAEEVPLTDAQRRSLSVEADDFSAMFEQDARAPQVADDDALKRLATFSEQLLLAQFTAAQLDAQLAEQEELIRRISEDDIPSLLKECGLSDVRLLDGTRVTVAEELECSISEERAPVALAWLREKNLGGVIKTLVAAQFGRGEEAAAKAVYKFLLEKNVPAEMKETVHPQTLKATLKAERAAGRDVPVEPFALRPYEKAKLTLPDGAPKPAKVRKRK